MKALVWLEPSIAHSSGSIGKRERGGPWGRLEQMKHPHHPFTKADARDFISHFNRYHNQYLLKSSGLKAETVEMPPRVCASHLPF